MAILKETLVHKLGLEGYAADEDKAKNLISSLSSDAVKALAKITTVGKRVQEAGDTIKALAERNQALLEEAKALLEAAKAKAVEEEKEKARKIEEEKESKGETETKDGEAETEGSATVAASVDDMPLLEEGEKVMILGKLHKYNGCCAQFVKMMGITIKRVSCKMLDGVEAGNTHDFPID